MRGFRGALVGAVLAAVPLAAHAHAESGWMHGLGDGVVTFLGSVQYLLPVIAAALLAGRQAPRSISDAMLAFGLSVLLGMGWGPLATDARLVEVAGRGWLVVLGLLLLLDSRQPRVLGALIAAVTGVLAGLELVLPVVGRTALSAAEIVGFLGASVLLLAAAGSLSQRCRQGWRRIVIRVVGSWIAAIALMAVAFLLRPPS
jgi:hydrogenase/urease accessory protein HupE